jgi:signal recognition particle receptor subunit beta
MALFNYATKEITLKVVYYGPGLSGKTTNLQYLHEILDPNKKGKLISLATETDRTLFFDFLPVELGKLKDFSIRFQLYTVPGQVKYNSTRKIVLKGADAIVFVADSQKVMREANMESFANMEENLIANNLDADDIPFIFQYNKRDLSNIMSVHELNHDLNPDEQVYLEAEAVNGIGVEETFQTITKLLIKNLSGKHKFDTKPPAAATGSISQSTQAVAGSTKPLSTPASDSAQAWQRSVSIEEVLKEIKEKEYKTSVYQEPLVEEKPSEKPIEKILHKKYEEPADEEPVFEKPVEEEQPEKAVYNKSSDQKPIADNIYQEFDKSASDKPAFEEFIKSKTFESYSAETLLPSEESQNDNPVSENTIRQDEKFDTVIEKLKEITQVLISIRVSLKGIQDEMRGTSSDSSKETEGSDKPKTKKHWLKFKQKS